MNQAKLNSLSDKELIKQVVAQGDLMRHTVLNRFMSCTNENEALKRKVAKCEEVIDHLDDAIRTFSEAIGNGDTEAAKRFLNNIDVIQESEYLDVRELESA